MSVILFQKTGSLASCCHRAVLKWREPRNDGSGAIVSLDTVVALAVLAVAARGADDEDGAALAAARLVGRHFGIGLLVCRSDGERSQRNALGW
jgi:hypothetical protein